MTTEGWVMAVITAIGVFLTVGAILFAAGGLKADIQNMAASFSGHVKTYDEHVKKNDEIHREIFHKVSSHAEDIAGLKSADRERRHSSGGHRTIEDTPTY